MRYVKRFKKASARTAAKFAVGTAVAALAVAGLGTAAWAAPTNAKNATPVTLSCDNGQTYTAVVSGGGSENSQSGQTYNPAHLLTDNSVAIGNSVLIPVAFGESTFSLYVNGVLVDQATQPAAAKGNGNAGVPTNATPLNCTYSVELSQTDPTTGDVYTLTGSGSVVGFIPGA